MPTGLTVPPPPTGGDPMRNAFSPEVERAVLSVCLDGRHVGSWSTVLEHCAGPAAFYDRNHRLISLVIDHLATTGQEVDSLTIGTAAAQWPFGEAILALKRLEGQERPCLTLSETTDRSDSVLSAIGGETAIAKIVASFGSVSGLAHNAKQLGAYHRQRQVITVLSHLTEQARGVSGAKEIDEVADQAASKLGEISRSGKVTESIGTGMAAAAASHDAAAAVGDQVVASWGIKALDDGCRLARGRIIVLAARPGCGKTSMALQAAVATRTVLNGGDAVAMVSLEMGADELARIIVGRHLNIGRQAIERGWMSSEQRSALNASLADWRANDIPVKGHRGQSTADEICAWMRAMHRRSSGRLHLVVIDYLGLIQGMNSKQSTNDRIGEITRKLKTTAMDLNVCVLLLCQMSREGSKEKRAPELTDLRDSGNIEQDADAVVFLWSDITEHDTGIVQVNARVAKNRNGPQGSYGLEFLKGYGQRFRAIGGDKPARGERMANEPTDSEDLYGQANQRQEP